MYVDIDVSVNDKVSRSVASSRSATLGLKGSQLEYIAVCQSATLAQLAGVKSGVSVSDTRYRGQKAEAYID